MKTNFGHLEAAAGIAGLIKVVLALDHGSIPPHLHLRNPNPHIEWQDMCVIRSDAPAHRGSAAMSGASPGSARSGSVARTRTLSSRRHRSRWSRRRTATGRPTSLTLSARSAPALDALLANVAGELSSDTGRAVADVCYTANVGRAHFEERVALVGTSRADIVQRLAELRRHERNEDTFRGRTTASKPPGLVALFSGQTGAAMQAGRRLHASEPTLRKTIAHCADILVPLVGERIRSALDPDGGKTPDAGADPRCGQAAAFVWQYALAELWRTWGVVPTVALGYGIGEYAAACMAGVFGLEDALTLVVKRVELALRDAGDDVLCAVFDDAGRIAEQIATRKLPLRIVAINGPEHAVVSGASGDVAACREMLAARGVETRLLTARSTSLRGAALDELESEVGKLQRGLPTFGLISCATGRPAEPEELRDPAYWRKQCGASVDFRAAMQGMLEDGYRLFLEMAPNPVLLPLGRNVAGSSATWLPTLQNGIDDWTQLARSLAALYTHGVDIDWRSFHRGRGRRVVSLPTYPFQHKPYWVARPSVRSTAAERPSWRDWLYELNWRALAQRSGDAHDLREPDDIARDLAAHIEPLAESSGVEIYREFAPRLDELCGAYIIEALEALGWDPARMERPMTAEALREELAILPEHGRLLARMLEILAEDGILKQRSGAGWECIRAPESQDAAALAETLWQSYPECAAELDLTINCGRELARVLTGEADPMQLLFPDGSLAPTERLYQESAGLRMFNSLVRDTVASAVSTLGTDRRLRILELGAGTGAATSYILPVLRPGQTEYVFTDVSHAFLAAARKKFGDYPFVEYRLLDAGKSALEQGFREDEFDIVIAANVIHATPDLRHTLANIRQVLAPDGLVVLLEGTVRQRFGDLTVGLTPGWWSFTDDALRPSYALLDARQWRDLFLGCGFTSVTAIPDGSHPLGGAVNQQSVIVARAATRAGEERLTKPVGDWLVLCDEGGTGDALASAICERGGRCVTVRSGDGFQDAGDGSFTVDPGAPTDFKRLLDAVSEHHGLSLQGAVHCWALDRSVSREAGLADLEHSESMALGTALYLAQALASVASSDASRLVFLTRQAQPVSTDEACSGFAQASLWGLARVIELEHAELRCLVADLDGGPVDVAAQQVLERMLLADSDENQLAIRDGRLFALRAAPSDGVRSDLASDVEIVDDASYIVTGGLSGLGLRVADWLVQRGARHIILIGRRPPGPQASESISAMTAMGASIRVVQGDVAAADCTARLESEITATGVPLRGIVHCAGAIDDGALLQQDWARFQRVMAAKVYGTWNLHRLSEAWPVDFFILFSTGASFLGSPGQSNHAAANAFMDALAHYRHGLDLPALTINWGPWGRPVPRCARALPISLRLRAWGRSVRNKALRYSITCCAAMP